MTNAAHSWARERKVRGLRGSVRAYRTRQMFRTPRRGVTSACVTITVGVVAAPPWIPDRSPARRRLAGKTRRGLAGVFSWDDLAMSNGDSVPASRLVGEPVASCVASLSQVQLTPSATRYSSRLVLFVRFSRPLSTRTLRSLWNVRRDTWGKMSWNSVIA